MSETASIPEVFGLVVTFIAAIVALLVALDSWADFVEARRLSNVPRRFVARVWFILQMGLLGILLLVTVREIVLLRLSPLASPDTETWEHLILNTQLTLMPIALAAASVFIAWSRHYLARLVTMLSDQKILRVLVIDDDPDVREMMKTVLGGEGFHVRALEANEGLALVGEWPPDVAVIDLMMPEMGGIEVIQHIRALAPSVKIILYSARNSGPIEYPSTMAQADAFLGKPFDIEDLLKLLR